VQIESDYSYKKETKNYLIKAVKLEKQDKHSAFDRLEKSDSTQVPITVQIRPEFSFPVKELFTED